MTDQRESLLEAQRADPKLWTLGIWYYNPEDPALWVPKRHGWGATWNMANRWSWLLTGVMLFGFALVVYAVAESSQAQRKARMQLETPASGE